MLKLTKNKMAAMKRLSDENGIIGALAIDQRGSLKKMISNASTNEIGDQGIIEFKKVVSRELTKYSSSILLDPEYGLPAAKERDEQAGLLLAYEKTGYDATKPGRLPDLLDEWSVKRLKEEGADAIKFLLYYDVDEAKEINDLKHAFVERLGSECVAEDIPFFLELVSYDANIEDVKGHDYAKIKPHKVNDMMKEFSKERYQVDVLKVEVPVNMNFVEGFTEGEFIYTKEQAAQYFNEQSEATHLPYIYLSAGVSAQLFRETLEFAAQAGADFNGVLCGRATWKNGVEPFAEQGEDAGVEWLQNEGKNNITELNSVLKRTAKSWMEKVEEK
ncbi:tagatose-bisphosphate aldolase [Heyndrickxia oleronia]|jgi:tagatose 1,6-diphosphate aldolase|uniref:Tagatose 1,6-diphosphate aldolase n=1 Tax=Heyndrickxia oleronia TaxID=38875 RepID=A0A8E2ICP7_9BACI|nr:tagatose-bisphosphate aldolase [Heyndrickxia oleronia]MCI1589907.1 tagatose-bisphosphate aldolase [Heyndrickxia oleronia]MCI1611618.1 tagatose-bisphosphate aldolase [Heyndrickxia oleronia]MCI1743533.1 tagatose-bisphosphate aldolase [Heyndrickxia oleronia]MCI1760140.1 tagatose-bisphosphate aldolase [Heyndrickxia oleronia]MEC1377599.1 tagatose-bisphosphate aldolase [Heyndrickxia oleronia]